MKSNEHQMIPKSWGYELIIVNKPEYCGKLLHFNKGKSASLHFHISKDETFYVHKGTVLIKWVDAQLICELNKDNPKNLLSYLQVEPYKLQELTLTSGQSFHIPRQRIHQVTALEDTEVYEFSTMSSDDDSYRIIAAT